MREAGVNLVTVGVFSWATAAAGARTRFDFGWLDRVLDLLHAHGIRVDLATATASPPPWFSRAASRARCRSTRRRDDPVARQPAGVLPEQRGLPGGGRDARRSARDALRRASRARAVARQQRVRLPRARLLLRRERGRVPRLAAGPLRRPRHAQRRPGAPRSGASATTTGRRSTRRALAPTLPQPDPAARLRALLLRRAARRATAPSATSCGGITPGRPGHDELHDAVRSSPSTTSRGRRRSTSSRPTTTCARSEGDTNLRRRALAATSTRGLAGGAPWLLMEHSTSAVNWQQVNLAKRPGELRRNSLAHVARGANGALFFQWRASRSGRREVPLRAASRTPARTRALWREVVALGEELANAVATCSTRRVAGRRRARVGLRELVGGRAGLAPVGRRPLPRPRARVPRRAVARRRHRRHRRARRRPLRLPARARPEPVPRARPARSCTRYVERGGHARRLVLLAGSSTSTTDPARRLPRRVPRPARHPRRGVPAARRRATRARGAIASRPCGARTCGSRAPRRSCATRRRRAGRHPPRVRRRRRLVRRRPGSTTPEPRDCSAASGSQAGVERAAPGACRPASSASVAATTSSSSTTPRRRSTSPATARSSGGAAVIAPAR